MRRGERRLTRGDGEFSEVRRFGWGEEGRRGVKFRLFFVPARPQLKQRASKSSSGERECRIERSQE